MKEATLAIIKPNAGQHTHRIVQRLTDLGFFLGGTCWARMTKQEAEIFYQEHQHSDFFNELTEFMSSAPVMVLVLEHMEAVSYLRKLMGHTDPLQGDVSSIRAFYGESVMKNAIHGSDSVESARREIAFFFPMFYHPNGVT